MTSVKQGGFNSGHTKSLQGRSGANDRSHSPVTEVEPSSIRQNGEFEAAHCRQPLVVGGADQAFFGINCNCDTAL